MRVQRPNHERLRHVRPVEMFRQRFTLARVEYIMDEPRCFHRDTRFRVIKECLDESAFFVPQGEDGSQTHRDGRVLAGVYQRRVGQASQRSRGGVT